MVAVDYFPMYGIRLPQQRIGLFHISLLQLFPYIGAADIAHMVFFLFNHMEMVSQLLFHVFQEFCIARALIAKAAVRPNHDLPGAHAARQYILHEILRHHAADFFIKWIFHQIINPHPFHIGAPLHVGGYHGLGLAGHLGQGCDAECKDGRGIAQLLFQFLHGTQKLLMPPVPSVKLTQGDNGWLLYLKFRGVCYIPHPAIPHFPSVWCQT